MHIFPNPYIEIATVNDALAIVNLLNSAYRGEDSKKGWTTEAHLIAGSTRTNEQTIIDVLLQPDSVFLKYTDAAEDIIGCVNLQKHDTKMYLGMFSVSPHLQGAGIGKQLLDAADFYAKEMNCTSIYMSVISVRSELIAWYQRHGYKDTGERKAFVEDAVSGKHLQSLEFMFLEKRMV
jgi:ribosomal protein S18 acetylase RimI-like enzyme